ncbi:hypothetical protein K05K4_34870 [Vibrio alginolyticus]|uniref:Uncharacterized protein n=1 Tax=Vibrio alginolyticus TaxID=663 RepID=A0A1W6UB34_VIBAL|nr:hypothetical protein K05K4_34710 [Vibrio alginolyticus]ARP20214.1 hypothetical protein K05K4_34870 [Vibrio alginolyticus]
MNAVNKSILFMLMSTLSLSVTGLLAKQLSGELSVTLFSFLRFFGACAYLAYLTSCEKPYLS